MGKNKSEKDGAVPVKSNRPKNTGLLQQQQNAWQPILTPRSVIPLLFVIGVLFTVTGGLLWWTNERVEEISIDYTNCIADAPTSPKWAEIPSDRTSRHFKQSDYGPGTPPTWQKTKNRVVYSGVPVDTTVCSLQFDVLNELKPPVYMYYRLTNFFQNHRRYVKSYDAGQLKGEAKSVDQLTVDCNPIREDSENKKPYYPCGLIADSLFNDTITSPVLINAAKSSKTSVRYSMTMNGTAWPSDRELYANSSYKYNEVVPPPNWRVRYPKGYTNETGLPDLVNDEPFQVWMRTAALPTFSKLYRKNVDDVMQPGRYQVDIQDYFPVHQYGGTKGILLTTRSALGSGRNPFMAIAYFAVGGICLLLGLIFAILNCAKGRKVGGQAPYGVGKGESERPVGFSTGHDPRL